MRNPVVQLAFDAEHEHPAETSQTVLGAGARRLVAEVWLLASRGVIDQRSPAADAALDLRDTIDPRWDPLSIITSDRGGRADNGGDA